MPERGRRCVRWGSPSQMRGKGIPPTAAVLRSMDHPHRCEEKFSEPSELTLRTGSPPQVWGKVAPGFSSTSLSRITPTGARKSQHFRVYNVFGEDHPRRCEEKRPSFPKKPPLLGSPPTGAGKSHLLVCQRIQPRDHPCRCGEKSCLM